VTITLEPAEGGTSVRLVHSGLTPEQAAGHLEGWNHYGDRLMLAAQYGDAGIDEWAAPKPGDPLTAAEASLAVCQAVLRGSSPRAEGYGLRAPSTTSTTSWSTCSALYARSAWPVAR